MTEIYSINMRLAMKESLSGSKYWGRKGKIVEELVMLTGAGVSDTREPKRQRLRDPVPPLELGLAPLTGTKKTVVETIVRKVVSLVEPLSPASRYHTIGGYTRAFKHVQLAPWNQFTTRKKRKCGCAIR